MTTVSPEMRSRFDSLTPDVKAAVMSHNVQINNLADLIAVLEVIVKETES